MTSFDKNIKKISDIPQSSSTTQIEECYEGFNRTILHTINKRNNNLQRIYLKFIVSSVKLKKQFGLLRLRWSRNLSHNIISEIDVSFNDKLVAKYDSIGLDFESMFWDKNEYKKLIGNIPDINNPTGIHYTKGLILPSFAVWLPIPILSKKDNIGIDITNINTELKISIRKWEELLILDDFETGLSRPATLDDLHIPPDIFAYINIDTVENNDKQHKNKILTEYFNTYNFKKYHEGKNILDNINFSVNRIYFGIKNVDFSNYSTQLPLLKLKKISNDLVPDGIDFYPNVTKNDALQIAYHKLKTSIQSKNINEMFLSENDYDELISKDPVLRLQLYVKEKCIINHTADYYSHIHPYNVGANIPEIGYHMYSFSPSQGSSAFNFTDNLQNIFLMNTRLGDNTLPFLITVSYRIIEIDGENVNVKCS